MAAPPIIETGWVVGAIHHATTDGSDAGLAAESTVNVGTVTFTPSRAYALPDPFTAITLGPLVALLDSHGDLHPQRQTGDTTGTDTEDGVSLPVGDYTVTYALGRGSLPSHPITVTAAHTTASPLALFTTMSQPPYVPPAGTPVNTLRVPGDATERQVLGWVNGQLDWITGAGVESLEASGTTLTLTRSDGSELTATLPAPLTPSTADLTAGIE